jgi:hypothetical protein
MKRHLHIYADDLINRHIFVARGKKKGGAVGAVGKTHASPFLPERRAYLSSSFFRISYLQPRYHVRLSSVTYIDIHFARYR